MLEIRGISKSFGGIKALKNVNFSIKKVKFTLLLVQMGQVKQLLLI
jgi:ABC-type sugar transport system ATPase subunit